METYEKKEKHIKSVTSSFQFNEYRINNAEFRLNPEAEMDEYIDLDFNLDTDFYLNKEEDQAMVILRCVVFEDYIEKELPFYVNVEIVGNFFLNGDFTNEEVLNLCKVNATAVLFPYLRAYISNLTALAGVPCVILPTINIQKLLED